MECKNEEFKWACENKCVKKGVCPKFVETPQICKKCMKECKKDVKVSAEEVKTKCQPVCKNECWGPKWETSVCKECFKGKCVQSGEVFKFVEGGVQGNGAVLVDEVKGLSVTTNGSLRRVQVIFAIIVPKLHFFPLSNEKPADLACPKIDSWGVST